MRLLRRSTRPQTKRIGFAKRYVAAGADEARRLGHDYVGTEHVLLALTSNAGGGATRVLGEVGVQHADIRDSPVLARLWAPRIDQDALATLGIDLEAVRERLEETFGYGALERAGILDPARTGAECVMPRLKQALEHAFERAGGEPVRDEHVLLGMLNVRDSVAAQILARLGVSLETVEAIVRREAR